MFEKPEKKIVVKATCPSCKKVSEFEVATQKEKHRFQFGYHDCPKCRKQFLTGWEAKF